MASSSTTSSRPGCSAGVPERSIHSSTYLQLPPHPSTHLHPPSIHTSTKLPSSTYLQFPVVGEEGGPPPPGLEIGAILHAGKMKGTFKSSVRTNSPSPPPGREEGLEGENGSCCVNIKHVLKTSKLPHMIVLHSSRHLLPAEECRAERTARPPHLLFRLLPPAVESIANAVQDRTHVLQVLFLCPPAERRKKRGREGGGDDALF